VGKFSTTLPVEEIHVEVSHMIDEIYIVLFKAFQFNENIDFEFKYNTDMDIGNFKDIVINQISIFAKYLYISKRKVILKDENLKPIVTFEIPYDRILAIRKYHSQILSLSIIGLDTYWYVINENKDKIVEIEELKHLNKF